jgi:hypothetical protein
MPHRSSIGVFVLATALCAVRTDVGAQEVSKYPTWKGQWRHEINREIEIQGTFDQTKAWGTGQGAPLTPEYRKVHEDSMRDQANGGLGNYPTATCRPSGMPRMMTFGSHEYIITPDTTYIVTSTDHLRRVFTDGRDWSKNTTLTYDGTSIGKWIDEDGDGVYDVLEAETRYFKGPRAYDATGLPLAFDNQSVFKERFFIDKANPNLLHDVTTVIDNALTRPWTSDRQFERVPGKAIEQWGEFYCQEGNANIMIGNENYFINASRQLMPAKPNQAPPDLKYFNQPQK